MSQPPQGIPPQGHPPQGHPPQGHPPQGYPPQGHPPQGYGGPPPGYPGPPAVDPRAKRYGSLSHWLGWGGVALIVLFGPIACAVSQSAPVGGAVAGLGLLSAIVGAVLGQIGRALQGRVI